MACRDRPEAQTAFGAATRLDAEQLLLLGLEVLGADHALVAELGELLQLGGVVPAGRCCGRRCSLRRRRRLLFIGLLVLGGPFLLLAMLDPARNSSGDA